MFNSFIWLDGILLSVAQKFCDKVQRLTGLTKFRLEKWALVVVAICYLTVYVFGEHTAALTVLSVALIFSIAIGIRALEIMEADFLENGNLNEPCFSVRGRIAWVVVYALLTGPEFVSADFADKVFVCGNASYILFVYFNACIPRPPSKSKMRELYEKGLTWLNDQLKPAPVPATN